MQSQIDALTKDMDKLRFRHHKLCNGLREVMGYHHWPMFDGDTIDGILALLRERLKRAP